MDRELAKTVNYTSMFKAPWSFRITFHKFTIPYTFELEECAMFAVSFFIVQVLFGGVFNWIDAHIMLNKYVLIAASVYGLTRLMQHAHTDGKRVDHYMIGVFLFFVQFVATKWVVYRGQLLRRNLNPTVFTIRNGGVKK